MPTHVHHLLIVFFIVCFGSFVKKVPQSFQFLALAGSLMKGQCHFLNSIYLVTSMFDCQARPRSGIRKCHFGIGYPCWRMLWLWSVCVPCMQPLAFWNPNIFVSISRPNVCKDGRAHRKFVKAGLALKEVITWHQLPIKNNDDEMEIKSWPLMLPHNLVLAPAYCLLCYAFFSQWDSFDTQGHSNDAQWPQRCSRFCKWQVLGQFARVPWLAKACRSYRCFGFQPIWWWGSNFWPCRTLVFELGQWSQPIAYQQPLQPLSHWTGTFKYVLENGKQYKHHFARTTSTSNWKFWNSWDLWVWRPPWTTHCMQRWLEISCAVLAPGPTTF